MFRVVQTVEAFKYPAGKVWGPYSERADADQRIATLRSFQGDGVIEEGDFGTPCGITADRPSGSPVGALEMAGA